MQLGPSTASLACARLIVPFAPFTGIENSIEVYLADVSWGSWVLPIVLRDEVRCLDIRGYLLRVVFSAKTLPLDQELEPPPYQTS